MSFLNRNRDRRLIPRWRSFSSTVSAGELAHHVARKPITIDNDINFKRVKNEWERNNNLENATELISYAYVLSQPKEAIGAAEFILKKSDEVLTPVRDLATSILKGSVAVRIVGGHKNVSTLHSLTQHICADIHVIREKLRRFPRNSILWVELSRLYAVLGQDPKAKKAMLVALKLSTNNRFVLRAGARLAIHLRKPDYALSIIQSSAFYKSDPWLLATEISINEIMEKTTTNIRHARNILKSSNYHPAHLSELAGSVGTLDLMNGSIRAAKKNYAISLISPNDNSLAQVEWAIYRLGKMDTSSRNYVPCSYEANARHAVRASDWDGAISNSCRWALDEPFSSSPFSMGSFLSASIFEDYEKAIEFCDQGLRANDTDSDLINNKAVSLIHLGRLKEAREVFHKLPKTKEDSAVSVSTIATAGLMSYRKGDIVSGREMYEKAIRIAKKMNRPDLMAAGQIYLAQEESRVNGEKANEYIKKAKAHVKKSKDSVVLELANKLNKMEAQLKINYDK